jgi:hypothetical protein
MLNMMNTRIVDSDSAAVESGALINEEGTALVYVKENGVTKVRPSTGVAGEIFAGASLSRSAPPAVLPNVEEFVIPAGGVVELARTPLANNYLLKIEGAAADNDGASAAGHYELVDSDLTFHADDVGKPAVIQYMYEPTVSEARTMTGDVPQGTRLASTVMGSIGRITRGYISTNMFDASADWANAIKVKLGANGVFTVGGSGATVPGAVVMNAPSSEDALLTIHLGD